MKNAGFHLFICFGLIAVSFFYSCGIKKNKPLPYSSAPKYILNRIPSSEFPDFLDDMFYDALEAAIQKSITYLQIVPENRKFKFGKDTFSAGHLINSLQYFQNFIHTKPSEKKLKKFIEKKFLVYRSIGRDSDGKVFFTGYYEPALRGSLSKTDEYRYPVYSRPLDLDEIDLSLFSSKFKGEKIMGRYSDVKFIPYYERKEIEADTVFSEKAKPVAWVNDKVELFFLQIQGSGIIDLDDGTKINVHYNTTNGRPYKSIGKLLIDQGKISRENMSMQAIRAYLHKHPDEVDKILTYNKSYVFFNIEEDGPLGCLNLKLTPGRSIALDRKIFPSAALGFIATKKPLIDGGGKISSWSKFTRFVLNHDTGGAIKGPGRADIFWGKGKYAEVAAGYMQHKGDLYFIVLKPDLI